MKLTEKQKTEDKIESQMTPMIDVVFQLLVFFLFSFKIIPTEGEIGVNMPPLTSGAATESNEIDVTEKISIRLVSAANGQLADIVLGEVRLGRDVRVLTQKIRNDFVGPTGKAEDVEVEIDADRTLRYAYVIWATNAIMRAGIEKINFTDPHGATGQ